MTKIYVVKAMNTLGSPLERMAQLVACGNELETVSARAAAERIRARAAKLAAAPPSWQALKAECGEGRP